MDAAHDRLATIRAAIPPEGLFAEEDRRLSPEPLVIDQKLADQLARLGHRLNRFNRACNELYQRSVSGKQPAWIADYLDRGKPPELVEFSRRKQFRGEVPQVIRPSLVLTEKGFTIAELDPIPRGVGLMAWMNATYAAFGTHDIIGGANGIADGFRSILGESAEILVSNATAMDRSEMQYLGRLAGSGAFRVHDVDSFSVEASQNDSPAPAGAERMAGGEPVVSPPANFLQPSGLHGAPRLRSAAGLHGAAGLHSSPGSLLYRFFELFDLPNIPTAAAMIQAMAEGSVRMTPPIKPYLEERLWFALFWLRPLREFWRRELSEQHFLELQKVIPHTWILDPEPLPQHAVIPGLEIQSFEELKQFPPEQRDLIIKISGFDEKARDRGGFVLGPEASQQEWEQAIANALAAFPAHPHIVQRFHQGRIVEQRFLNATGQIETMRGRVRLCPYYFVIDGKAELRGALATVCPADMKMLHPTKDAILAPTAVAT